MFRKLWFWVVVGVAAAGVVFAFARNGKKEKENTAALKTARVTRGNLLASITATGVARPIQTVELKCKASGEITQLPIDDGQYVRKGDLICKLDQTTAQNDYEQAKSDRDVALASEKQQKKEYDRVLELYGKKLVSEAERDAAELNYQRAHSQSVRAEAALSTAAERLADTELRAPIDGIILRKNVEEGQVISSGVSSVSGGTTIALLADLDQVNVLADVDETDIGKVKIGQTVKAVADAFPEQEFTGRVLKIAPLAKVEQNVTTFEVTAEVDNPGHLLKSGMNANVEIMTAERRNVLTVPNEAVKELSEVIPYFPEEERKKYEGFAMGANGGNRTVTSLGGGGGGGGQQVVVQGGPGGMGGGGRPGFGNRSGGVRQFRGNFDFSKMDTSKLDPQMRERIREWMQRQSERKKRGDSAQVVEIPRWVLVKEKDKIVPRRVMAGVSNLDHTEIVSGLKEGDEVIAQPTSMLAKERELLQQRLRSMGGIPGMSGGGGGERAAVRASSEAVTVAGTRLLKSGAAAHRSNINFLESLSVSLSALRANKVRSFLTMLGIIIGVSAVIAMIALGQGAKKAVEDSIQALGSNLLMIRPGAARSGMVRLGAGSSIRLNEQDLDAVKKKVYGIEAVAPELSRFGQLKYGNKNWNCQVIGTTPEYELVRNAPAEKGAYFTRQDGASRRRVAVLGQTVVENLFGPDEDPVGRQIKINNIGFDVIGVLKVKGQQGWFNQDDIVLLPLETAQKRLLGLDFFTNINVRVADERLMEQVSMDIEQTLRRSHRLTGLEENDFSIRNQADIMATRTETAKTLTWLLASVAFVSLMVGGIGIMNIMLVSVTERTREIGVRMALGARKRDILSQFLTEAVTLSLVGGLIGIGLGVGATLLLTKLAGWTTLISAGSVLLSFLFAAAVGIFFGLYPARKAARLDPIEALRYE